MTKLFHTRVLKTIALLLAAAGACAAQAVTEITLPGTRFFPESITSTNDGTIYVGSLGHGSISRIAPGTSKVEEFIKPATGGLHQVIGVFADEKNATLWVCSNNIDKKGENPALKAFDLKSGEFKATYPMPGADPFCNDIAVADDGTAYVSDTQQESILMLKRGTKNLEPVAKDPLLAGADGLAFGDKSVLYINSFTTGKFLRVDLGADGKSTKVSEVKLSRPLVKPDGLRTLGKNRLLQAENTGKMTIVTLQGQNATVTTIKEGLVGTPGVTATKGMAWIVEGKLDYLMDPAFKDKDPGQFKMVAVPLPKN